MRWYLVLGLFACNTGEDKKNDLDGDGFISLEGGGDDCNDEDALVYPGAQEACDALDNDCDGATDEEGASWYPDVDQDGFGDSTAQPTIACSTPLGLVSDSQDCNDQDATVFPDAVELCDGLDNDCDSSIDEDAQPTLWYTDADSDGFGDPTTGVETCEPASNQVLDNTDCNDNDALIYPGTTEQCDGIDQDCDLLVDDDPTDGQAYAIDADQDGYGATTTQRFCTQPQGYTVDSTDCDDNNPSINPGSVEICDDANADENCNTLPDDADPGVDQNTYEIWYLDLDADGYGTEASTTIACDPPPGFGAYADCNDSDTNINPGEAESDDGIDNDCDLNVDEDFLNTGDVIVTEIHRQARFGEASANPDGTWFELYNTSSRSINVSGWYFIRTNAEVGTDMFQVNPDDNIIVDPGEYLVFCKMDRYSASQTASSTLICDYIWGDETQPYNYTAQFHDNTFNPQRDDDDLQLWFGGDATTGTLMDNVHWYYDATNGYWPRDAARSMTLDPLAWSESANNDVLSWCSIAEEDAYLWYNDNTEGGVEYGTPGAANYDCP